MTALRNFEVVQKSLMPFLLGYQTLENGEKSPTVAIFRLALTCKKAKKILEFFIEPHKLSSIAKYHALDTMISVFYARPDFHDKVTPSNDYHSLHTIWEHPVFGGSILDPVNRLDQQEFRLEPRPNKLLHDMLESVSEEHEFICMKNIKLPVDYSKNMAAHDRVMDIYVLIKKGSANLKSEYYKSKGKAPMSMLFDSPLFLTGFGRCI